MVKLTLSPAYAEEGTNAYTTLSWAARLASPVLYDVTVSYRLLFDGSADETDIWNGNSEYGQIVILAGDTSATIDVSTSYYDDVNEYDEFFTLELFNPTDGVTFARNEPVLRAPAVIRDDDGSPSLSYDVSDPVLVEGDKGTKKAVFAVHLSRPAEGALSLKYSTADGSALAGSDYQKTSGTLKFKPGQEVAYVSVPVMGDGVLEGSETFNLVVKRPYNQGFDNADSVGTAKILDDDASRSNAIVSIQDAQAIEGTNDYTTLRFTLTLNEAPNQDVTVSYRSLFTGTAIADDLWQVPSGQVTFTANQTSAFVDVSTSYYDDENEADEVFFLELFNPSEGLELAGGVTQLAAAGTILDDDGSASDVALAAAPVSIVENEFGDTSTTSSVTVKLTRPSDTPMRFSVAAVDGTAKGGRDFKLLQNSVYFAPGQTEAGVKVRIKGDLKSERLETFELAFGHEVGTDFSGSILNQAVTIMNRAVFSQEDDVVRLTNGNDTARGLAGADEIFGRNGNDKIWGNEGRDFLEGQNGNDKLYGGEGSDGLFGGPGADLLDGGNGADKLYGDNGIDTVTYNSAKQGVTASLGGPKANTGDARGDTYRGIENLTGSKKSDVLTGNKSKNVISGGNGNDKLYGLAGNDRLLGQKGADRLDGGDGKDVLNGGLGNDRLTGGPGQDDFIFNGGRDVLTDFKPGVDTIMLDSDLYPGSSSARRIVDRYGNDKGKDVELDFGGGDVLLIKGVGTLNTLVSNIEIIA